MKKRIYLGALVALALSLAARGDEVRPYAWVNPEIETAHPTRGKLVAVRPVFNLDTGVGYKLGALGYANIGFWSMTDLSRHYTSSRRQLFNEIDPWLQYGYTWEFTEGWSLDSKLSYQWDELLGYRDSTRRTYREWINRETLTMPWFSLFTLVRWMQYPYCCPGIRAGIFREFKLPANFSIVPQFFMDGGPRCWNRRRFGQWTEEPARYHQGVNSATISLTLKYRFTENLIGYLGISQFSNTDSTVRRQVKARPNECGRRDLAFATVGLILNL